MRRLTAMIARVGVLVLAAGALLSACTVEVQQPQPLPPAPGPEPGFCTREYVPVCARRGERYQTFSNSCLARESGFRIVSPGECRDGGRPPSNNVCPHNYDPVCARRGGDTRTFANSCRAEESGFRIVYPGECRGGGPGAGGPGPGGGQQQFCTREYAPVCARRGGNFQTFSNSCEADAAGYRIVGNGPC